mmetsp:Transcript_32127/g.72492  ORF Transcript_32127/g.72492 Transcript_32127/m.72492 type:complete len:264 (-) Transcript_32127:292-1083(-)
MSVSQSDAHLPPFAAVINPTFESECLLLVNDHEGGAAAMNVKCSAGEPLTDLLVSALCVLTVLHGCRRLLFRLAIQTTRVAFAAVGVRKGLFVSFVEKHDLLVQLHEVLFHLPECRSSANRVALADPLRTHRLVPWRSDPFIPQRPRTSHTVPRAPPLAWAQILVQIPHIPPQLAQVLAQIPARIHLTQIPALLIQTAQIRVQIPAGIPRVTTQLSVAQWAIGRPHRLPLEIPRSAGWIPSPWMAPRPTAPSQSEPAALRPAV